MPALRLKQIENGNRKKAYNDAEKEVNSKM